MAFFFFLTLSQMTNFGLFQTERVCRQQFCIWWKWWKVLWKGRKHCGKRRNCLLRTISFPTEFSKDMYCICVKTRVCLGKGWKWPWYLNLTLTNNLDLVTKKWSLPRGIQTWNMIALSFIIETYSPKLKFFWEQTEKQGVKQTRQTKNYISLIHRYGEWGHKKRNSTIKNTLTLQYPGCIGSAFNTKQLV